MDHGRAGRERRGHQRVLGRHDRRLVHEEVAGVQPVGRAQLERARGAHLGAQGAEGVQVRVEPAAADHVAAGRRHVGPAEAREQRAGQQEGRADALGQRGVDRGVRDLVAADGDHVLVAPLGAGPEVHEQLDHRLHVADARHVAQHDLLRRQQRGGEGRQRSVLVAGGNEGPREGRPAFDDELLHARVRPGAGKKPAAKGIEGHPPAGSGRRADTLPQRGAFARRGLGAGRGMGAERVAAQAPARRGDGRCAPTRASGTRTRSCTPATGLLHDLDYERYPDLDTGHPRKALELFEQKGYPQELIDAVAGHATFLGVPRETRMAKTLYAVDELSGFIAACALVRPTGIEGMAPKSVKKKLKQPSFAAGVNRDEVRAGRRGARRRLRRARGLPDRRDGGARGRARAVWLRVGLMALRIIVLEGDETGQELLEQALRVLDPVGDAGRGGARALRPVARQPPQDQQRGRRRPPHGRSSRRASASRRRRSRRRAPTTSAAPTASCARRSTAR